MKLKVIGSSGAEFPGHNPSAFLIDDCILLDAGTIGASLNEAAQWKIRDILITHAHLDHIRGIPFLADNLIIKNKKHSVTVISISNVLMTLKKNLLNNKIWPDFTNISAASSPVLILKAVSPGRPFKINSYTIIAYKVNHSVPAVGYIVEDRKGKRFLYTGDTGPTDTIWKAAKGICCAIIEVSFPNRLEVMAIKTGHLTTGLLMKEINKMESLPEKILITHPKPQYLKQIKKEIEGLRMNNIKILKDGEIYRI
ncbi:MAG: 3',5'-cyclic-nucleotide phosphodiesterase [Nitrospirae bacterium]|nr:3',5'-cyclic-nucleotide phosphodiesterase [Nitrospirota bacterium]